MPYLTDIERKEPREVNGEMFNFKSRRDLGDDIIVTPKNRDFYTYVMEVNPDKINKLLAKDISVFIGMFMIETHPYLNGFSGLDCLIYKFE